MRHDLARDRELDLPRSAQRGAVHRERLDQPVAGPRYWKTAADGHPRAVRSRRHGETRARGTQSPAGLGHAEGREMSLEGFLAGLSHSGHLEKAAIVT